MFDHDEIARDFQGYLKQHEQKELLRFVAVGSVDDGKSTLIGRLLHDTSAVPEDQVRAARRASRMEDAELDFSLFTDGLQAEREQGITIDVAYRYFSTAKRKFIIADTPGHVQYTRNMVTGASTADVGIILIDARLGVLQQSRRHAYLASLLGIPHLVVCVNKMDLRDYDYGVFAAIREELATYARKLAFKDVTFVPISALKGDNVVARSAKTPWYDGPTLLELLESLPIARDRDLGALRFPVQTVLRPNRDYRAFAGEVASGVVRVGDEVELLPSRRRTRVTAIDVWEGSLESAFAGQSIALRVADEIDTSRGDMITTPSAPPTVTDRFDAHLVWLH
jgi:sulfate adenylyltransferase large subunit